MRRMLFLILLISWSSTAYVVLAPYEKTQKEEKQTQIAEQYQSFPKEGKRTNIARQVPKSKLSKKSS